MKKMTCKELGGACDLAFEAETFEEISALSQAHGREMHQKQDPDHLAAMQAMGEMMQDPEAMAAWMAEKRKVFEAL